MEADTQFIFFGILMGLVLGGGIMLIWMGFNGIDISQETADDICIQLTGNESAIAKDSWDTEVAVGGKLICITPSYDATQNIVFKKNNE